MEQKFEQIREQQKETWNKFSSGWKKWDDLAMEFMKPVGDEIIRLLEPRNGHMVLDIASGTGEPGLTIASMLSGGKVIISDLAEDMLEIARENAAKRGIKNFETHTCDVCELPFPDNTFDSISCRFGFMFFPDMTLAVKEMVRVLKPGSRIASAVWDAPEKNFWVTATMGTIKKNMDLPSPPPDAPGIFRCAKDDVLSQLFKQAGLKNVSHKEIPGKLNCKTTDVYWNFITEVAAPVVDALDKADDETREKIRQEVFQAVKQKYPDGNVNIESSALVIYGEK